jgi:hypothetical protein
MTTENLFLLPTVLLSDVAYLRKALRKGAAHARELTCTFGLDRHRCQVAGSLGWIAVARPLSRLDFFIGSFDSCGLECVFCSARLVESCLV